jgi:hypothetical protein
MIDPELVELMNLELDGLLPPERSAELRAKLGADSEAAGYFAELARTVEAVNALPQLEIPAGAEERVLSSIPFGRYAARKRTKGPAHALASRAAGFFTVRRLSYAGMFAIGIVFGVLVYSSIRYDRSRGGAGSDNADLYGSMGALSPGDDFTETASVSVSAGEVRGQVRLHESDRTVLAEVALDSPGAIDWVIGYRAEQFSLNGFRAVQGRTDKVSAAAGETRVAQTGSSKCLLLFSREGPAEAALTISVYSADRIVFQDTLTTSAAARRPQNGR